MATNLTRYKTFCLCLRQLDQKTAYVSETKMTPPAIIENSKKNQK